MENVINIKIARLVTFCWLIILLIGPGVLGLFFLKYQIFFKLEVLKLLLISISIDAPVLIINSFFAILLLARPSKSISEAMLYSETESRSRDSLNFSFTVSTFIWSVVLMSQLVLYFLFDFTNDKLIICALLVLLSTILFSWIIIFIFKKYFRKILLHTNNATNELV